MDRVRYRISLNTAKTGYQHYLQGAVKGESISREIVMSFTQDGRPFEFPTGHTIRAVLYIKYPGIDNPSVQACEIDYDHSSVIYLLTPNDVASAGILDVQLKIIDTRIPDPIVLIAPRFQIEVQDTNVVDDDEAEQTETYTALETALAQAQTAYNNRIVGTDTDSDGHIIFIYGDGHEEESDAAINAMGTVGQELIAEAQAKIDSMETIGAGIITSAQAKLDAMDDVRDEIVEAAQEKVDDASEYASSSATSASEAAASAIEAAGYVDTVEASAQAAASSASDAETSAQASAASASEASGYVSDATEQSEMAEAWANGTINGSPIPSTHPAHNNNAKYWKDQAQQIAGGEDLVKYTQQSKTDAEKAQARSNIGAMASSDRGVANGVASLDGSGRIPYSQLPESAMEYKGSWNASTNTPTLTNGVGTNGDFYIVSVGGTWGGTEFFANDRIIYDGTTQTWQRIGGGNVTSVAGKTGAVTLVKADVGLENVDNTSDLDKPISTATQTALNSKITKVTLPASNDLASFNSDGSIKDSGIASTHVITGTPNYTNMPILGNVLTSKTLSNVVKAKEDIGLEESALRNAYATTTDLTAGTSQLAAGTICLVYEA